MKRLIWICFLGLGLKGAYCQVTNDGGLFLGSVVSDTSTIKKAYSKNDLSPIYESKNAIEIRFSIFSFSSSAEHIVLYYNKKWMANYHYYNRTKKQYEVKSIGQNSDLDSIFNRLVMDNIFSLPDQNKLDEFNSTFFPKTNEIRREGLGVSDGVHYSVEFKVKDQYRRYRYNNPLDFAEYYKASYELKLFSDIVKTFEGLIQE